MAERGLTISNSLKQAAPRKAQFKLQSLMQCAQILEKEPSCSLLRIMQTSIDVTHLPKPDRKLLQQLPRYFYSE